MRTEQKRSPLKSICLIRSMCHACTWCRLSQQCCCPGRQIALKLPLRFLALMEPQQVAPVVCIGSVLVTETQSSQFCSPPLQYICRSLPEVTQTPSSPARDASGSRRSHGFALVCRTTAAWRGWRTAVPTPRCRNRRRISSRHVCMAQEAREQPVRKHNEPVYIRVLTETSIPRHIKHMLALKYPWRAKGLFWLLLWFHYSWQKILLFLTLPAHLHKGWGIRDNRQASSESFDLYSIYKLHSQWILMRNPKNKILEAIWKVSWMEVSCRCVTVHALFVHIGRWQLPVACPVQLFMGPI